MSESPQRGGILEHELVGAELGVLRQGGVPPFLEPDIVIRRHAVDAGNLVSVLQQASGDVEADKSCRAGDQTTH